MKLADLVARALAQTPPLPDIDICYLAQDTRELVRGEPALFVARKGATQDAHHFVAEAIKQGAVAVVGSHAPEGLEQFSWHGQVPYIRVADDKRALAKLAATLYEHPSERLKTFGVTGTDGKTTTSFLLHHLLSGYFRSGLLSTAEVRLADEIRALPGHFTTPEAPTVQYLLAECLKNGCTHAVIESSSHGFAQHRLDEVDYDIGIWTNLSAEHLDFHKTLEAYRDAKAQLMRRATLSILNADDPEFAAFAEAAGQFESYGEAQNATWRARDIREEDGALYFSLHHGGQSYPMCLPMIGRYNVHNALAAIAAAHAAGISLPNIQQRLKTFAGVPGRMQVVQYTPFSVVVDFAHTPPALEKALHAVRPQTMGRLIVVIGAAGERDPGKRRALGCCGVTYADLAVFTEEDSRSEDVQEILTEMAAGAKSAGGKLGETYFLEPERPEAIARAMSLARPGDLVLLAGKGHERTLERAGLTLAWDEIAEAKKALRGLASS